MVTATKMKEQNADIAKNGQRIMRRDIARERVKR